MGDNLLRGQGIGAVWMGPNRVNGPVRGPGGSRGRMGVGKLLTGLDIGEVTGPK